MARKIYRYTLTPKQQARWDMEDMQGWRDSMVGVCEDDAREEGAKKFVLCDRSEQVLAKGDVTILIEPEVVGGP